MVLDQNTVFVVTGAAGGITSAIVTDLAVAIERRLLPARPGGLPRARRQVYRLFRKGREALKQALIDEAKARGEKVTPGTDRQAR